MFRKFFSTYKKLPYNKTWVTASKDGVVTCQPLTKNLMDGALKVFREAFIRNEPLCKAVGILEEPGAEEELLQTCYDAAKDGVSIVAIDTRANEVIGIMFNKIEVLAPKGETYYEKMRKSCKHKSVKAFYDFTIDVGTKVDLFKRYKTDCLMEIMSIATLPDYKQRNVAGLMTECSHKIGQLLCNGENVKTPIDTEDGGLTNTDAIPSIITAQVTSKYTQILSVKFGYDNVLEVNFKDYKIDGKTFSERIGDVHKTCWIIVKRLDS